MSERDAPGLLAGSQPYFSSGESSRRGKAGAAWGCRPTEHPLPTPAGNPAGSRIHSSSHGSGFAFTVSSESRPLSFGMKAGTQSDLQGWACPGKSFDITELRAMPEAGGGRQWRVCSPLWRKASSLLAAVRETQRAKVQQVLVVSRSSSPGNESHGTPWLVSSAHSEEMRDGSRSRVPDTEAFPKSRTGRDATSGSESQRGCLLIRRRRER